MRNICYTFIFIGFTGFTVHAQYQGGFSVESMIQSLTGGGTISDIVNVVSGQLMEPSESSEQQAQSRSAIEGPLFVEEVIPETNQTTAEVIDSRTGRYPPRLKIDFTEFPLHSWMHTNNINNEYDVKFEIIVQRIKNQLRLSQIHFAVEDRTVTVSGMVATDRQRNLVESMLRFEPGIDTVHNKIIIAP